MLRTICHIANSQCWDQIMGALSELGVGPGKTYFLYLMGWEEAGGGVSKLEGPGEGPRLSKSKGRTAPVVSTEQCLVHNRCSKHAIKMEPWLIIWLNISQPTTHKLHVAINCEMDAKKIWEFKKYINKLPEIQSCHFNDVTLTCNLSCFMVGEKVCEGWELLWALQRPHTLS